MAVTVAFVTTQTLGVMTSLKSVRAMEVLAVSGTTTTTARDGEYIVVGNDETSMIRAAYGTTPDADATAETSATTAGYPIGASQVGDPYAAKAGDKVNVELAD